VSENVADIEDVESQDDAAVEAEAPATPSVDELATLKKRLAGKDQAYTKLKAEADAIKAEREALSKWKAEREEADLTEVEKLQRRLAEAEQAAADAAARAERVRLTATYPLAVDLFGDDPLPSEERLSALQQRLANAATTGEEEAPEPRIDANNPRRPARGVKSLADMTEAELRDSLREQAKSFGSLEDVSSWVGG
jgi:hypothetical protein